MSWISGNCQDGRHDVRSHAEYDQTVSRIPQLKPRPLVGSMRELEMKANRYLGSRPLIEKERP
ncbi:hypothetical protein [Pseudoduganella namucuonensis]|uniref:Uncharacterized protein n=1 Tax=Pseudoduganella namucuonensis TaxID=1035707 RepID=A0A1I7M236_9BURK|nr:hypothetical protein [Pseudoduganella namucuonensis]SFV16022.1 hypothetical protein SAMN05216552_104915 [Pseudoduganella namucuonensis]